MADDDQTPWYRSLLVGVGALLGVALLVGALVGLVALGAVSVTGLGEEKETVQAEPSLHIPERTGGDEDANDDDPGLTLEDLNGGKNPSASSEPEQRESQTRGERKPRKPKPPRSVISLSASPVEVDRMERIYLSGTYPGGEGASLQVQRLDGRWTAFPTSTTVSGETFQTYVMTGQSGVNKFRVVDTARRKASNPVTVTVR